MTPSLSTWRRLLLPCCLLFALSAGELELYRDLEIPESARSIALRELVQYLESQNRQHRESYPNPQRSYFSPFSSSQSHKKHHLQLQRRREILEALTNKDTVADILGKSIQKDWNYRQTPYNEPINEAPRERERYFPYYEQNLFEGPLTYNDFKFPYFPRKPTDEDDANLESMRLGNYPNWGGYEQKASVNHWPLEEFKLDKGMKEEPALEIHRNHEENDRKPPPVPAFTFSFDQADLKEKHPFAVKPNDPRYYQDGPFFFGEDDNLEPKKPVKNGTMWNRENTDPGKSPRMREEGTRKVESTFKDSSMAVLPDLERRSEYNPVVVPVNHDLNNDIYFIAIVAGCSAAAMFALVLIALTWCRLKRGAKAAADIEYPAYGVTGPNKEVSPSGDQRLAQSAQMYHFQHQKQQIIAMENRVSATRDPGSVSEAESEEENEEGDYTVYECPGLASTGEMEVKNPMFHDDPTPATPAQSKEEDHI